MYAIGVNVTNSLQQNINLNQHKSSVHLNERKFKCNEENCGKNFTTKHI